MKLFMLCALLAACTETHTQAQVEIKQDDCINCHTTTLVHPENTFPLTSMGTMHTNIACQDCHRFSVGPGLNLMHVDCFHCHFRADIDPLHTGLTDYQWDPVNHDFCLRCHTDGLAL
jgi:hypothetical protein